jgi:hypothetical protein
MKMKGWMVFFCMICFLAVWIAGCATPVAKTLDTSCQSAMIPEKTVLPSVGDSGIAKDSPAPGILPKDYEGIPILLSETDWQTAKECGWTKDELPDTTALLLGNCQVRHLLRDGGTIVGIRYDMNFLGSRCRQSTRPAAGDSCDWCLDAGPVLVIRYHGMTTEYLADTRENTISRFSTGLPEGAGSASNGDSDVILFRNGTVFYTFNVSEEHSRCSP